MPIRISGLNSGLDTESIISALVSSYSVKKDNYVKAQTKLNWKQDAWKSLNTKIHTMYTNIGNLRFSSAYSLKKSTVSDTTKATVTASSSATNGSQSLKIEQLAKAGYLTGGKLASGTTEKSTLEDLGYKQEDGIITVTSGGKKTDINVTKDTTISDFVKSLNAAGVKASYDATNQRMFVSASDTGVDNDFSLIGSDANGITALGALGLNKGSTTLTEAYQTNASYAQYTSDGSFDAGTTKTSILEILKSLQKAYADEANAKTENVDLNEKLKYANAYKAVNGLKDGPSGELIKEIETLNAMSDKDTTYVSADGTKTYTGKEVTTDADGKTLYKYTYKDGDETKTDESYEELQTVNERINKLAEDAGLIVPKKDAEGNETEEKDNTGLTTFITNLSTISAYQKAADDFAADEKNADAVNEKQNYINDIESYYKGTGEKTLEQEITDLGKAISDNEKIISDSETLINDPANAHWDVKDYSDMDDAKRDKVADSIVSQIETAVKVVNGDLELDDNATATRVDAQDAKITLNGAQFESSSNSFTVNGLTIQATGVTAKDEEVTITTATDTQGLYDKIKDFLTQYNDIVNEVNKLYNAASATGYEPLTTDEKNDMSDKEIEQWETKIKDSLLRRDTTLGGVLTAMTNSMAKSYEVNGKTYSLASFGISTLGYFNSAANENYAYHIAGDPDDASSSAGTDKLMAALNSDPDSVVEYMKQLTSGLYKELDSKMKSSSISSAYTVYNDKEMASEYSDYTDLIKKWEEKLTDIEDSYYKKFAAMESALATLQSSSSSLSSLLG